MSSLDELQMHEGCSDQRCKTCLAHNNALCDLLDKLSSDSSIDSGGEYHAWLGRQGLSAETEGGWWSREALTEANVRRFIKSRAKRFTNTEAAQ